MNVALIIAGGVGSRMMLSIPKQFLSVFDKPIIVYTLEAFQNHPDIEKIAVVCLEGWESILQAYAKQYNIDKLEWVFQGGETGQLSIRNGIYGLKDFLVDEDIILVHDSIRPYVSQDIISDCIVTCKKYGSAIVVIPSVEAMLETNNQISSTKSVPRENLKRTQTPQALRLKDFYFLHKEAEEKGIINSIATCTLMIELGKEVFFSKGSEKNIKLTTVDDIDIFKALIRLERNK
jgi:2-C-methyl-D-erythritol 4-phosphate cytidylyltransferase